MTRAFTAAALLTVSVGGMVPAAAHHSYAMFDDAKTLNIEGTVQEFQWTNPHVWVQILVAHGPLAGKWRLEGGPVAQLKLIGWSHDVVRPGDRVSAVTHPLKNGTLGGALMWLTLPSGKKLEGGGTVAQKTLPDAEVIEH